MLGQSQMMVLVFGRGRRQHLTITLFKTILELSITHHQHILLISRHQTYLEQHSGVSVDIIVER